MKNTPIQVAVALSLISSAFAFESHFDPVINDAPLFLVSVPVSCILLSLSLQNSLDIHYERDECIRIFNGYNDLSRVVVTHFELIITVVYCSSMIYLLYCME